MISLPAGGCQPGGRADAGEGSWRANKISVISGTVPFMPHLALWQWLLGSFCAFLVGLAKTGLPGAGILTIPLMVLAVADARLSAGWLLPILCTADVFAVVYWRRH